MRPNSLTAASTTVLNAGGILHIATERQYLHAKLLQFFRGLQAAFLLARAENQVRAHFREALGHLPAEANGAAGDDRHPAAEIEALPAFHGGGPNEKFPARPSRRVFISYVSC